MPERATKLTFVAMNEPILRGKVQTIENEKLEEELLEVEQAEFERNFLAKRILNFATEKKN